MAQIESNSGNHRQRGALRQSKKLSTRVDLTPMVDLGFLLITFFILTTTWSTPRATRLILPADGKPTSLSDLAVLSVVAGKDNSIFYYEGTLEEALQQGSYGKTNYSQRGGIGDIIRDKQRRMDQYYKGGRKELMILIKASEDANLQNIVSLLDETTINMVGKYALVDLGGDEKSVLVQKKLM